MLNSVVNFLKMEKSFSESDWTITENDSSVNVNNTSAEPLSSRIHVREYFSFNQTTSKSKCKVQNFKTELTGNHPGNLLKHLKAKHHLNIDISKLTTRMKKKRRLQEKII